MYVTITHSNSQPKFNGKTYWQGNYTRNITRVTIRTPGCPAD